MSMRQIYTTVSNAEFYEVLREDSAQGETNWTVSRHAKPGDRILLYICAPVSAIVAVATVSTKPEQDFDPRSPWIRHWLADMDSLRMLKKPITRTALLETFPAWGYWKQPRNSVQVPERFVADVERMIG